MENGPVQNQPAAQGPRKVRHGCLTIWLWLIIIVNIIGVILTAAEPAFMDLPELPGWYLPTAAVATLLVVVSAIALLRWKIWGFWGLVAMEGVSVLISIAESGNYLSIISGIMGVAILVALLNLGGDKKAWNQLT